MNEHEAAFVLSELHYSDIEIGSGVVKARCSCSNRSDRTFRVFCGSGPPGYYCHRCKNKGPLLGLIWEKILQERRPYTKALYVTNESIISNSEVRLAPGRMDYSPFGKRAVERAGAPEVPYKPVTGIQLDLNGGVVKSEPPRTYTESDFERYKVGDLSYMKDRGFTDEVLDAYQIRHNPRDHRVVFPIRDWDGVIKGVSQRLVWDKDWCHRCKASLLNDEGERHYKCPSCRKLYAKYLHSKGLRRNEVLYGEWLHEDGCIPVLVEGMTDVMNLWQHGMNPANGFLPLAVMGSHPGRWQIGRVLEKCPDVPVVVVCDRDDPANYPDLPEGVAPGDLMLEKVREYAHAREPDRRVIEVVPDRFGVDPGDLLENHVKATISFIKNSSQSKDGPRNFLLAI